MRVMSGLISIKQWLLTGGLRNPGESRSVGYGSRNASYGMKIHASSRKFCNEKCEVAYFNEEGADNQKNVDCLK
jgi:hypothetical protein